MSVSFDELWTTILVPVCKKIFDCERLDIYRYNSAHSTLYNHSIREIQLGEESQSGAFEIHGALVDFYSSAVDLTFREITEVVDDDVVLERYGAKWRIFSTAIPVLNGLMRYVNRSYTKRYGGYEQGQMAQLAWKNVLMAETTRDKVVGAALRLIERSRRNEKVDLGLVKAVIASLAAFGFERSAEVDESDLSDEQLIEHRLRFYVENFEKPVIEATKRFYENKADELLASLGIIAFMHEARRLIHQEEDLCGRILHAHSRDAVIGAVQEALIVKQLAEIRGKFLTLLEKEAVEDLNVLFELCTREPRALKGIAKEFEDHVRERGQKAIEEIVDASEPSAFVSAVLAVYGRFRSLVLSAFGNHACFVKALDIACEAFVDDNAVSRRFQSATRVAEILARHLDRVQRRGVGREEGDVEDVLRQAMIVFKYLREKDIFEKLYTKLLAARLVGGASANDDAEKAMIVNLRDACGYNFTTTMSRMFNDIVFSKDLSTAFRNHENVQRTKADFSVLVLSAGTWPFAGATTFSIPESLEAHMQCFQEFYAERHQSRKLIWHLNGSRGELQTRGFPRKYTFVATALQMALLLHFNNVDSLTEKGLALKLGITEDVLKEVLEPLLKVAILRKDDNLVVNAKFTSKRLKIDLTRLQTTKAATKKDDQEMEKAIEKGRMIEIQAATVRILKMRRRVEHNNLIAEVIEQVKTRFIPRVAMIKKCFDVLMEKEYLRRAEDERDIYEYIS